MTSDNLDQSAQYPSQENDSPLYSNSSEDNVAMPIVRLDEITVEQESSKESVGICSIGIEPQALEAIIYRILVEADQPLWIDEIIDALKEEMTGIQFTREYLIPILTSSTTIRTFSPYALFTFVLTESQRNTKTKEKIQRSKSNLNSNWDKWVKNGGKTSEAPIKAKKGKSENLVELLNSVSRDEVAEDVVEIRMVDPQKMYRGRPIGGSSNSETEKDIVLDAEAERDKGILNNETTEAESINQSEETTVEEEIDNNTPIFEESGNSSETINSTTIIKEEATSLELVEKETITKEESASSKLEENKRIPEETPTPSQELPNPTPKVKPTKVKKSKADKTEKGQDKAKDTGSEPPMQEKKKRKKSKEAKSDEGINNNEYNLFAEFETNNVGNGLTSNQNKDNKLEPTSLPLESPSEPANTKTDDKETEEIIVENSNTHTTQDMNNLGNNIEKENTPMEINTPQTPLIPDHDDEEIEIGSLVGQEISRWTDENGQTFIVRIADPSELTEEEREWLEKAEHDRMTKTPDQIEREKARAAKLKAMGEGTTAFVTSLKTRGSRKTVAIDKKSWGSLFDE